MFRRTPTIGDALIYVLYEGDYEAMKRDGIEIPPCQFHEPQEAWYTTSRYSFSCLVLMGGVAWAGLLSEADVDRATNTFSMPMLDGISHCLPLPGHSTLSASLPLCSHSLHQISPLSPLQWQLPTTSSIRVGPTCDYNAGLLSWNRPLSFSTHMLPDTAEVTTPQHIFRHIRQLSDIVGSESTPSTMTSNSALGPAANLYLWAHGYQPGSIRLIQEKYERAGSMASFVNELADADIPIAEGWYIFSLISGTA